MYGIRQCNRIFLCGEIGAFFTEIFFQISVVILNSHLHYQIFKFVIDNSDISLNCLQHIQKRRNFDAKVTCHQPICLLLHAILSGVGVHWSRSAHRHLMEKHLSVAEQGLIEKNPNKKVKEAPRSNRQIPSVYSHKSCDCDSNPTNYLFSIISSNNLMNMK